MKRGLHEVLEALFGGTIITGTIKTVLWISAFCTAVGLTVHVLLRP